MYAFWLGLEGFQPCASYQQLVASLLFLRWRRFRAGLTLRAWTPELCSAPTCTMFVVVKIKKSCSRFRISTASSTIRTLAMPGHGGLAPNLSVLAVRKEKVAIGSAGMTAVGIHHTALWLGQALGYRLRTWTMMPEKQMLSTPMWARPRHSLRRTPTMEEARQRL